MSNKDTVRSERQMSAWERNLIGTRVEEIPLLLPGLLLAAVLAWLSIELCEYVGVNLMGFEKTPLSSVTVVILFGLVLSNLLPLPVWLRPGVTFAVKKVLRLGIILLGIRLSVFDVFRLGAMGVPIVLLCICSALLFTTLLNRWLRLPERLGTLIAIGTSICGVSAIVAGAPAIDAKDEEVSYAVAVITIFGILATLFYPYAAYEMFGGDPVKAGLFLGTSVHDTAQVAGAALVFSGVYALPRGLDVATITKMVRNVFMVLVIPLMTVYYRRRAMAKGEIRGERTNVFKLLPLFVVGFLALAVTRSIGDAGVRAEGNAFGLWDSVTWNGIQGAIKHWATNLLVVALAGVGLSTRLRMLKGLGVKPFVVGLGAALVVGLVSFVTISLLGRFVTYWP